MSETRSDRDLKKLNDDFRSKHKDSAAHVLSAINVNKYLGADANQCAKEAVKLVEAMDSLTIDDGSSILKFLKDGGSSGVAEFQKAAATRWPEATVLA